MNKLCSQHSHVRPSLRDEILEVIFRDRVKFISLISSAVVQELQTPLVIIRNLVSSLLVDGLQDSSPKLSHVLRETDHLLTMIAAMDNQTEPSVTLKSSFAIRPLIDQVSSYFHQERLQKGVSFHIDVDPNLHILSESNRLKIILIILLDNAVKSFLVKEPSTPRCISIYTIHENENLHLVVSDTGVGMNAELQKNILADINLKSSLRFSSGISLALAYKLAKDIDVEMKFLTDEMKGTLFTLSFDVPE